MDAADLVLEQLRLIRAEIASIKLDGREVENRLATLEVGQGTILQHLGHLASRSPSSRSAWTAWATEWSASNTGWTLPMPADTGSRSID